MAIFVIYSRNKTCFPCLHCLVNSRLDRKPRRSRGFSPAQEFAPTLPRFTTGYGGTENTINFFYKIIFSLKKEKYDIRSA